MSIIKSADLFFCEGSSDKEYHLQLVENGALYRVDFQYGRRGSSLIGGFKVEGVTLDKAEKAYQKVLSEKLGKGYRPMEGSAQVDTAAPVSVEAVPVMNAVEGKRRIVLEDDVLVIPQLLDVITEDEVEKYLRDDRYGAQQKIDGVHKMLHKASSSETFMTNKKGKRVAYQAIYDGALKKFDSIDLDGEEIGSRLHAFDLLECDGKDLRGLGYGKRYEALMLHSYRFSDVIEVVPLAIGYEQKKAMYDRLKREGKEGIVFKLLDASFKSGKGHGAMWKCKFYSEASVIVLRHNAKNSIAVGLLDGQGKVMDMGNVTTIGHTKPPVNSICEIRYLYAYPNGGCFYQPTFKEPRTDVDREECTVVGQRIKFKPEED